VKKLFSLVAILVMALTILAACGNTDAVTETPAGEPIELTLEELSAFDGMNGNKAYIAVDGNIYDVTKITQWLGGKHNGYFAGKDFTTEIKTISPHGLTPIKSLTPIGTIVD